MEPSAARSTEQLSGGSGRRGRRTSVVLVVVALAVVLALSTVVPATASHVDDHIVNPSIVFYKPTSNTTGVALFGTLDEGVLTRMGRLRTGRWTHAAISHDTLLFYSSASGEGITGTLWDGRFTRHGTFKVAAGFNRIAASCDSVLFYNKNTGAGRIGLLDGGWLSRTRNISFLNGMDHVSSSCDTIVLIRNERPGTSGFFVSGLLENGGYTETAFEPQSSRYTRITNTADSYIWYDRPTGSGIWGRAQDGSSSVPTASSDTFGSWTHVAGTGNSVLFYNSASGVAAPVILEDGVYSSVGTTELAEGWKIIVGAR